MDPFVISENKINILVIENLKTFRSMVMNLLGQTQGKPGDFVISVNDKEINIEKEVKVITDPFCEDINQKKVSNYINTAAGKAAIDSDLIIKTKEMVSSIESYIDKLTEELPYRLTAKKDITAEEIIKMASLIIEEDDDLMSKISDLIRIAADIMKFSCIIFINVLSIFDKEEVIQLRKTAMYEHVRILFIEPKGIENYTAEDNIRIVDYDLCEI